MEVGFGGIASDLGLCNAGFEPKFDYQSGDLRQVISELLRPCQLPGNGCVGLW